jgi:hypothetical protein
MRRRSVAAVLLVGALLATVYVSIGRKSLQERRDHSELHDDAVVGTPSIPDNVSEQGGSSSTVDVAATELRNLSQNFRNSTFLIAIRGSGFSCDEVVAAHETVDGVWLASCMNKLGYTLNVRGANELDVHPVTHYFDAVAPRVRIQE